MSHRIVRTNLTTGAEITIAARDDPTAAADLADTLNRHAVGYLFRVAVGG